MSGPGIGFWYRSVLRLAAHPSLWVTAVRQYWRLVPPRWWSRRWRLPVPDPVYVSFRMHTAYGPGSVMPAEDLIGYLRWCRSWPTVR